MNNNYILTSDGGFASEDELYHYGIKGMKWGVIRARKNFADRGIARKKKQNIKLEAQAAKFDVKAGKRALKNIKKGYEGNGLIANKKSAKLNLKAAKFERNALKQDNSSKKYTKLKLKAAKARFKSLKSMDISELSTKKDYKYQIKAAQKRFKIEKNNLKVYNLNTRSTELGRRLLENDKNE